MKNYLELEAYKGKKENVIDILKTKLKNFGILILFSMILFACHQNNERESIYKNSKPYTRWWWFASIIDEKDIKNQLDWLKTNNFGGVEIAWIYPYKRDTSALRYKWLGKEWSKSVEFTKKYADSIGLGCDFTFGTGWPFGDSYVKKEDATQRFGAKRDKYKKAWKFWEDPNNGYIINHLDSQALYRYTENIGKALSKALEGEKSLLFCDSWEVPSYKIWTTDFDSVFYQKYNYDIKYYMDSIYSDNCIDYRYDYYKLVSGYIINQFYIPFTNICHQLNSFSRVQCMGAPVDIINAYVNVDVPETEAMLYNPSYSRIVASAAALSSKVDISCETFTCLYGFPAKYHFNEQTADLKLVVDALFANGVNQIYWHGMPFNPIGSDSLKFYATVHVGKKGNLAEELPQFNHYMEKVSKYMKKGTTYSDVALYVPLEDNWIAGRYPKGKRKPGSRMHYDLQHIIPNNELIGHHPLWINHEFLCKSELKNGKLCCGDLSFSSLYIDVKYLDYEVLKTILQLAKEDFPVCIKREPKQPGKVKNKEYHRIFQELISLKSVSINFSEINNTNPLVEGDSIPEYWCKKQNTTYNIFFAHPLAKNLKYPIKYGQSYINEKIELPIILNIEEKTLKINLEFEPYQSILLKINENLDCDFIDIKYTPKIPEQKFDEKLI